MAHRNREFRTDDCQGCYSAPAEHTFVDAYGTTEELCFACFRWALALTIGIDEEDRLGPLAGMVGLDDEETTAEKLARLGILELQ